jgi:copper(I)-binding protein
LAVAAAAAAACTQGAPQIAVEQPEIRASLGNTPTSAAYLTLRNSGSAPDRLVGADCACADMVMSHQTSTAANGVASMAHEAAVTVPAHGSAVFEPGGRHLMLTGVKAPIRAGDKVTITLRFETSGAMPVVFTAVDTPGARG